VLLTIYKSRADRTVLLRKNYGRAKAPLQDGPTRWSSMQGAPATACGASRRRTLPATERPPAHPSSSA